MATWGMLPPISLDESSDQPKYIQLAQAIESRIRSGDLPPNTRLPSENTLDELLGLSRSTIRKALEELENSGFVYRRQGMGTFAADMSKLRAKSDAAAGQNGQNTAEIHNQPWEGIVQKPGPGKNGLIGLLVPTMLNQIYPQIVRGVEDVASSRGYSVFIGNTYSNRDRELSLMEQMIERHVDGLVLEPTHSSLDTPGTLNFELLRDYPVPFVLIDNDIPGLEVSRVSLDDFSGGQLVGRHLVEHGHRRMACIYMETVLAGVDRRDGFMRALEEAGIESADVRLCPFTEADHPSNPGYDYTVQLLREEPRPTAIFYFNDELAINGIQAIREAGLEIPRDISIVGFDNTQNAASPGNRLTTIEHPKYFAGRWAADILFDQIEGGGSRIRRHITVHPELIIRESVGDFRE